MSMSMTMGMDHTGLAGREMARLMEIDIRNKFFFSLLFTLPIILYSSLGTEFLKLDLPSPIPLPWLLFILTTPVFFYSGWIFLYSTYFALKNKTLNMAVLIAVGIAIGAGTDVAIETAKVVLMKSDPLDILRAITLSKATVLKMKQNLFWASIYNVLAIPVAGGILYPSFGIMLRPEFAALLMSISSIIVATNAVLLKRIEKDLVAV